MPKSRFRKRQGRSRLLLAAAAAVFVAACNPIVDNLGNRALKEDVEQIKVGQTTRNEVQRLLGSPSSTAALDDNVWYYISARQEQWAFMKPSITDQQVLMVRFDAGGIVREVKSMDMNDAQSVAHVSRTTPIRGGEPGLLRSLYDTLLRGPITRPTDPKNRPRGPDY
jgi:outer membrane protein assembly factor BamE (lipoprotein component of BamABCDE complex)